MRDIKETLTLLRIEPSLPNLEAFVEKQLLFISVVMSLAIQRYYLFFLRYKKNMNDFYVNIKLFPLGTIDYNLWAASPLGSAKGAISQK